jgi:hypothetical protein
MDGKTKKFIHVFGGWGHLRDVPLGTRTNKCILMKQVLISGGGRKYLKFVSNGGLQFKRL